MNKWYSFFISGVTATVFLWAVNNFRQTVTMPIEGVAPFLIFWYMLWKLFHDKKKDE